MENPLRSSENPRTFLLGQKRIAFAALFFAAYWLMPQNFAFACTIFQSPFGDGRISQNFDLAPKNLKGALVANPANLKKSGLVLGASIPPAQWVSKWRSFTFSVTGAEFPAGGINEKGLFMGLLVLPETQFPPADDPRPALTGSQFVQYNLDVSENIDDVIASDKILRPFSALFKTHFFACDQSGECVVLQYMDGRLNAYRIDNLKLNSLTNSPYPESVAAAQSCSLGDCNFTNNSLWRFVELMILKGKMKNDDTYSAQAFSILDEVAQTQGPLTRFQVLYDAKKSEIQIRAKGAAGIGFLNFDFSTIFCEPSRQIIPIDLSTTGDLSHSWIGLTQQMQTEFALEMGFPQSIAEIYGSYPSQSTSCQSRSKQNIVRKKGAAQKF